VAASSLSAAFPFAAPVMPDQRDLKKDGSSAVCAHAAAGSITVNAPANPPANAILGHRAITFLPNRARPSMPGNACRCKGRVQPSGSPGVSRLALARRAAAFPQPRCALRAAAWPRDKFARLIPNCMG
jgi:hypothetical protein